MTARELYDCDTTFRLLVDEWVRERRCPMPLVDRCLDFGLESQADCARWAATEPDRLGFHPDQRNTVCGPMPGIGGTEGFYLIVVSPSESYPRPAHFNELPEKFFNKQDRGILASKTETDGVLMMLDNWKSS